jgi:hypothetical protein
MLKIYFIRETDKTEEEMENILEESRSIGVVSACEKNKIDVETFLTWYKFSRKKRQRVRILNKGNSAEKTEIKKKKIPARKIKDKKRRGQDELKKRETKIRKINEHEGAGRAEAPKVLPEPWWGNALKRLPIRDPGKKHAIQVLGRYFLRSGCVREPSGRKGYEVRITAYTQGELKEIRSSIEMMNYNLCKSYEKRGYFIQPIYGTGAAYTLTKIREIRNSWEEGENNK